MVFVMLYLGLLWSCCCCCCYTAAMTEAQSCMDGASIFSKEVVATEQGSPYRLSCAADATQAQSHGHLTWTRGCRQLPARDGPAVSSSRGPVQVLDPQEGNAVLEFPSLGLRDAGNYTCMVNESAWITFRLVIRESQCSKAPISWSPAESGGPVTVWARLWGADPLPTLRCDALLPWDPQGPPCDDLKFAWLKDGRPLANDTMHRHNSSSRSPGPGRLQVSSTLTLSLTENTDFGLYSCKLRNLRINYTLQSNGQLSHTAAVIAALVLTVCLLVSAVLYSWCHLDVKLWYRNAYGEHQVNDGKLYDAYISYVNNEYDRKFVHFIFKPHLENKLGHRVHLNDNDILPGADPSAELLMNISRCRRLVVVLSHAYLQQDWCQTHFRQGVLHMLELVQKPVFILLDGQVKHMRSEVKVTLKELQHRLTFLTWRHNSVTPASVFWKELALSMPRGRVVLQRRGGAGGGGGGDPQTLLHDDKDPILTLEPPDYLDCRADPHPSGDLGLRLPVYKALTSVTSRAPVLPAAPLHVLPVAAMTSDPRPVPVTSDPMPYEVDVSDLGLRSYAARTDFYCLVSDKDM